MHPRRAFVVMRAVRCTRISACGGETLLAIISWLAAPY